MSCTWGVNTICRQGDPNAMSCLVFTCSSTYWLQILKWTLGGISRCSFSSQSMTKTECEKLASLLQQQQPKMVSKTCHVSARWRLQSEYKLSLYWKLCKGLFCHEFFFVVYHLLTLQQSIKQYFINNSIQFHFKIKFAHKAFILFYLMQLKYFLEFHKSYIS